MSHAMIIEQNMVVGNELSKRLANFGFDSFDHVWTEDDAVAVADMRKPDLVLVGDKLETGSALEAARRISEKHDVPMLLVTADSFQVKKRLGDGAILEGPFAFSNIPEAAEAAQDVPRNLTAEWRNHNQKWSRAEPYITNNG